MKEGKSLQVRQLLYELSNEEVKSVISSSEDIELLYTYLYHYNWDNGFEIPQMILNNKECDLSTALLIFYGADGTAYLQNKLDNGVLPEQQAFIKTLYHSILRGRYAKGHIAFKAPLSKVQLFKLRKLLSKEELVFIEDITGKEIDVMC